MKVREIKVDKYEIKVRVQQPKQDTEGQVITSVDGKVEIEVIEKNMPYDVKESLAGILLSPEQKMSATELLKNNILAEQILQSEKTLLLETDAYTRLKKAVESFVGYGKNDVELVKRVLEAPEVEVEKKGG